MGKVFELTLTYIVLFVLSPWITFGQRPQVDHNLYRTVTMGKVAIASTASKDAVKRLIYDLDRAQNVLSEARTKINKGFKDLREDQDALAVKNGVIDVDGSEIMDINAGGVIMFVTRDTLTQIKGTTLEALFSGRWDKRLLRDGDGRVFLDVNQKCFLAVVDYLNEPKIAPPSSPTEMPHLGMGGRYCSSTASGGVRVEI